MALRRLSNGIGSSDDPFRLNALLYNNQCLLAKGPYKAAELCVLLTMHSQLDLISDMHSQLDLI